ncbi:putative E3 ubiquitin-protein ligase ZFP1 [Capsicum chacoense]
MGQRSMSYSNHFMDFGADQQSPAYIHPEPCVLYGSYTAFPHPNAHAIVPAAGIGNLYVSHLPGQGALIYGMPPANGIQQWQPLPNVSPVIPPPSNPFYPYVAGPSASTGFPVPVDQGLQLPFPGTDDVVGNNADNLARNDPHVDSVGGSSKQKNVQGSSGNLEHHSASAGASTSVSPVIPTAHESDVSLSDSVSREHGGNDAAASAENGVQRSASRSASGPETVLPNNSNQLLQGNYVGQANQFPGNPWLNQPFNSNGTQPWAWNQAAPIPYLPGGGGGYVLGAGNVCMPGYQVNSSNGGLTSSVYPPIHQGPLYPHHLPPNMQFRGGHPLSFSPQMTASSSSHLPNSSSSTANNPLQGVVEGGSGYMGPFLPTGFRMYRPNQTEFMRETNIHYHNLPNGVRIGFPGVVVADQHRDLRLDIDHMSYEELLALGERIGNVTTGLSGEAIVTNLKTRIFVSSQTPPAPESVASEDQKTDLCVICQTDYTDQEKIGILECGHEYHEECVKKWLIVKNTCAICNSTGLSTEKKNV